MTIAMHFNRTQTGFFQAGSAGTASMQTSEFSPSIPRKTAFADIRRQRAAFLIHAKNGASVIRPFRQV